MNVNRNDLFFVDQGMTTFFDLNITLCREERPCAPHFFGQHGTGKDKIQLT